MRLMATMRPRRVSRAFHTSPIPPAPIRSRISYGPKSVPGSKDIGWGFYAKNREIPVGAVYDRVESGIERRCAVVGGVNEWILANGKGDYAWTRAAASASP